MSLLFQIVFLAFAIIVPVYLHALIRLYGIIKSERPDWVQVRGSLSFFYTGLPRVFDPNVSGEVRRIAFSSRIDQLQSPMAASYAKRIRWLLPIGVILFLVVLVGAFAGAP